MILPALFIVLLGAARAAAPRAPADVVRPELAPLPVPPALSQAPGITAVNASMPAVPEAKTDVDAMAGLSLPMAGLQDQLQKGGGDAVSDSASADFMARVGQAEAPVVVGGEQGGSAGGSWSSAWSRGFFPGADGAKLSYIYRRGSGPAVLLVHGRTLGAESFQGWADKAFPGRPMMLLERRGYGASEIGRIDEKTVGAVEAEDVSRAVAVAGALGSGAKVGVLAYSLGAMLLPELDPAEVSWLALMNPGSAGMRDHMPPETQAGLAWLRAGYDAGRWLPWQKEAFVGMVVEKHLSDFRLHLSGEKEEAARLGRVLLDDLERRMKDPRRRELWVQETLWAGYGPHQALAPQVPVLLFLNRDDQTVPPAASRELAASLRRSAPLVRVVRERGGHLAPVFAPEALRRALEEFDAALEARLSRRAGRRPRPGRSGR